MKRKSHILGGFILWIVAMVIYIWINYSDFEPWSWVNIMWIVISLFSCLLGAEMADYDILWKSVLHHRHIITHSFILPGILCIPVFAVAETGTSGDFLLPSFGLYSMGYASHLFLDLFPVWKGDKKETESDEAREVLAWLSGGLTGDELYSKMSGIYLIHINPFKTKIKRSTFSKKVTRVWLGTNGFILLVFGIVIMFIFSKFYAI